MQTLSTIALIAIAVFGSAPLATAQVNAPFPRSYTETQAARGSDFYNEYCRYCHGTQLTGTEFAPGIAGAEFTSRWQNRPLRDLFELMRHTMPMNSPGGLSADRIADILAFMLKRAGAPAGRADLPARAEALGDLRLSGLVRP